MCIIKYRYTVRGNVYDSVDGICKCFNSLKRKPVH